VRREAHELPAPPSTDDAGVAGPTGDRVQEVLRFPFLALDLKDLKTPAFVIKSEDAVLEVPSLPVRVQVEPINDNVDGGVPDGAVVIDAAASSLIYKVRDDRPFIALAVLAVVALLAFITRRLMQSSRAKRAAIVPPPPRPAWEVAIERLDALMPLLQRGEVTVFVEKLMDEVLRDYLASRFVLSTGTRTTKEIVIVVRSAPRGVAPREVERALGFSDLPVLPEQQHLATRADRGEPVLARDAYAKAVRALLADAMPVKASVS
jgi:hypothetical protein